LGASGRSSTRVLEQLTGLIRQRRLRARLFGDQLFADPAWDMLLDLARARIEQQGVSVTSLCHSSGVPATTALRWIRLLEREAMITREHDRQDRRRSFVVLTPQAMETMERYLDEIERI
jgi:DNA-binding MarR family transcriptional regulator